MSDSWDGLRARRVRVICAEPRGPLAQQVVEALSRAGLAPAVEGPELDSAEGANVLVDDGAIPRGLARLLQLMPGRVTLPNVILAVARLEGAGWLMAEGLRDVAAPEDIGEAAVALLEGRAPTLLLRLREQIERDFLPRFVAELRQHAFERDRLLGECVDLVRAGDFLEGRRERLERAVHQESLDELFVQQGQTAEYLDRLRAIERPRLTSLPALPAQRTGGALREREPRDRALRAKLSDAIDALRQDGLFAALGREAAEALEELALTRRKRPLQGLRDCIALVERELSARLARIDGLGTAAEPVAALEERHLAPHGLCVLAPGVAVPAGVQLILRSLAEPPAEVYVTWCLDLRDLAIKPCADVLEELVRDLSLGTAAKPQPPSRAFAGGATPQEGWAS